MLFALGTRPRAASCGSWPAGGSHHRGTASAFFVAEDDSVVERVPPPDWCGQALFAPADPFDYVPDCAFDSARNFDHMFATSNADEEDPGILGEEVFGHEKSWRERADWLRSM